MSSTAPVTTRPLDVLIVSQYFWPENFRINDLATGLTDRGHRVTVLTGIPNYPSGRFFPGYGLFSRRRERYGKIDVVRTPLVPRGNSRGFRLALNYLSFAILGCITGLMRLRGRFDVIFVFEVSPVTVGVPALFIKWLKGAPILFWVLDLWPETLSAVGAVRSKFALRLVDHLVSFIYRHCDRILVQSQAFIGAVARQGADSVKTRYFPSWGEDVYKADIDITTLPKLPPLPAGFRIVFAGNIGVSQDFGTILRAAETVHRQYRDIHWIIVGDGRMADWVGSQVRERDLGKYVHLVGRFPLATMPAFFEAADVLLVSLRRDPIFALTIPGKIQSYLASGKPILAMLEGEGARIIEEAGAGLSCPAEDADALAQAVLAIYQMHPAERAAMGARGRSYHDRHFDRHMLFSRLEAWMYEVTADNRKGTNS